MDRYRLYYYRRRPAYARRASRRCLRASQSSYHWNSCFRLSFTCSGFGRIVLSSCNCSDIPGVGEALALPAAMAMIVLLFPEGPSRSRALSIWAAVASCGLVLGFLLSGIIVEFLGWRWIFLIAVPIVLFVLVNTAALLPRDKPRERKPLDVFGSILLTCAPLLFSYGIVEIGKGRNIGWLPFLAFIGASVSVALFVLVEMHTRNPLIPLSFFRNRSRTRANLATALLSAALSTSFLLLTFYLQDRLRLSALQAGLMLVPLAACLVIAVLVVPRLLGRWGHAIALSLGLALQRLG
uniref:Transmembrane efflux protein n=1 Tax=Klebsiella pneumoniae TaxID=573 RepID=A0A223LMV5_KLEPN|nr:Transmembrane efflux protein [Klebsiella pneumoniae]